LDDDAFSSLIALVLFFKGDDDWVVSVEEDDDDPFSRFEEARGLEAVVALLVSLECDWPMQWTGRWRRSQRKCVDKKRTLTNTQRESTKNAAKSKQDFSAGARRALVSFTNEVSRFFSRARRVRLSLVVGFCFTTLDGIISLFLRIYYLCRFVLNL